VATLTIREHSENWLAEKKSTAPATLVFYRGSVKKFLTFLGVRAGADISEIEAKTILAFRNELITVVSPKTVNHDMKTVKALFKAARRDQLLVDDPAEFIETVKDRADASRRPFTLDEVKRVQAVANDAAVVKIMPERQLARLRGLGAQEHLEAHRLPELVGWA